MTSSFPPALLREGAQRLAMAHPQVDFPPAVIETLLAACAPVELAPGEVLCAEGDPSDALWVLLRGTIRVEKRDLHGRPLPVGALAAPTVFGQMGIVDRARRSASCVADDNVLIASMDRALFRRMVRALDDRGSALRRLLLSSLTHQMLHGNARLRSLLARQEVPEPTTPLGSGLVAAAGVLEGWASSPPEADTAPAGPGST